MYTITCLTLDRHTTFDKEFNDIKLAHNFVNKCKYSKKIKVIGVMCQTNEELEYIEGRL